MGRHETNFGENKLQSMRTKEALPSIDIVYQMWLGFPIHEAVGSQKGKTIIHERRTNEKISRIRTPSREIIHFKILQTTFPGVPHMYYPNKRLDAIPGNHLHVT